MLESGISFVEPLLVAELQGDMHQRIHTLGIAFPDYRPVKSQGLAVTIFSGRKVFDAIINAGRGSSAGNTLRDRMLRKIFCSTSLPRLHFVSPRDKHPLPYQDAPR